MGSSVLGCSAVLMKISRLLESSQAKVTNRKKPCLSEIGLPSVPDMLSHWQGTACKNVALGPLWY